MDHISALRAFVQVAKRESFSVASRDLGTSASVVSRYVKELENDLGVHLMTRTTRRVALTESGQDFLARAEALLEDFDTLRDSAKAQHKQPSGKLRITAPLAMGQSMLAPLLPEFMARYPELSVSLHLTNQVVDLVEEGFDLGIRLANQLTDSSLVARQLGVSRTLICATPVYCERYGIPETPDALQTHNCLLYRDDIPSHWHFTPPAAPPLSVRVEGNLAANSGEALRQAVLGGIGIGLLPEFLIREDLEAGTLIPLLTAYEPSPEHIYVVYPHRKFVATKVRCFIDYCAEKFQIS